MPDNLLPHLDDPPVQTIAPQQTSAVPSDLITRIRSRCYWQTIVRPERFQPRRIADYSRLRAIVEESAVSLRHWSYPQVVGRDTTVRGGQDWAGEELDWEHHLELWRLYQSGQFVSVAGLWWDWTERTPQQPAGHGPSNELPLWDTIYRFTEIYEFASRLALTEAGDDQMRVETKIGNLHGRILVQDHPGKTGLRIYRSQTDEFTYPGADVPPIAREELIARPRDLAAAALVDLFKRFAFPATHEYIRACQDELGRW